MLENLDLNDVELDFDEKQGWQNIAAGKYHFMVAAYNEAVPGCNMSMTCEIMAGSAEGEVGRTHREFFALTDNAFTVKRQLLMAIAIGLVTVDELKTAKANGESIDIPWGRSEGRHFCGALSENEFNGETKMQLGFDIWPIGHTKAKGITLNEEAIKHSEMAVAEEETPDFNNVVF
jgi:hypothetical protein